MNMKAYQEFVRLKEWCKQNLESQIHSSQFGKLLPLLKKKYKARGIDDVEKMIALEQRESLSQHREIDTFLESSQVYEISDKHKWMLMLTKEPKLEDTEMWNQIRLPFPEIFIDVNFKPDEVKGVDFIINGILIRELKKIETKEDDNGNLKPISLYGLTAYISGITSEGLAFTERFLFPVLFNEEDRLNNLETTYTHKKSAKFLKSFIINFILFLKDREVVWVESKRGKKNQERRIRQNKIPLPNSRIIKLEGQLKRYMDSLDDSDFKGTLSHRFWVSGHWRTYRSKRYKQMRGKIIWVEPFKKGSGVEIKKVRRLIPEDDPNEWDYADIKPLDKPLSDRRWK